MTHVPRIAMLLALLLPPVASASSAKPAGPSMKVSTTAVTTRRLQQTLTAYGKVEPDPAYTQTISTLQMGQVTRIMASQGEHVHAGQALIEMTPTPQSRRAYQQAKSAMDSARATLQQQRSLLQQHLVTRDAVASAQQVFDDAQSALQALKHQGSGAQHVIRASGSAVVTSVSAAPGAVINAGQPLLKLSNVQHLRIRLGIEPEDAPRVRPGQPVQLQPVFARKPASIKASIHGVHAVVNPSTRLVDAMVHVSGKNATRLIIGSWVRGTLSVKTVKMTAVALKPVGDAARHQFFAFV
ncbi:efflux RND transporter periplasmic adaptor subunit [Oleiagrimonas sp.]|jgi:membrane fusion protein (multidrug efflux system)|uniref:efflux RND transporter periplasmic adaptor subunit n=1 Tax=Oleiagrimonas sp. TaxID=2010330 RepID=UPI00260BD91C|nr:efflux RND transporter periplasmic adaptor subunit [Oleiagrimonas sp.]MDA3914769.1 efflux RND transporter periplasmic adaptor subunit [Oleiagrimonas sp.]